MALQPLSILHTGVFFAVLAGLYGWIIGALWSPFLLPERGRSLFDSLPPSEWYWNYALWIPVPAAVWGFVFGTTLSVSLDVRPPTQASEIYVAGIDGIIVASAVALLLWPTLLLFVLPARWDPQEYSPATLLFVLGSLVWYLVLLAGPTYVLTVFAGFGDAMAGP